jgi:arabinofuranosyltransferase
LRPKRSKPRRPKDSKAEIATKYRRGLFVVLSLVLALVFILLTTSTTPFFQDDAYISFRYVKNFLNGDGLVFNIGERVEGYTNFLWIIILSLMAIVGLDLESWARLLGILLSAATVLTSVMLARRVFSEFSARWMTIGALGVGLWVAVNPAVSYWSGAGLETALFLFLVILSVERLLANSSLSWGGLVLATMTRPEGGLVFLICYAWFIAQRLPAVSSNWWQPLSVYVLALIPFGAFKWLYYGSLFPNPFYAKTGFSPEYWQSGVEYLWLHLSQFGLWGILPLFLLLGHLRSGWRSNLGFVSGFWLVYAFYIVSIGGDVLRAHRFFVPIWPIFAVGVIGGIMLCCQRLRYSKVLAIVAAATIVAITGYQYFYSSEYFSYSRKSETQIVAKMRDAANVLKKTDKSDFCIAASTIGRLGYELFGHRVIDMLGLTDSVVARHPESIAGMETTWKERHFNATYILSADPDYILFSTGYKPSAPAERALFLHSKFRQNYYVALYNVTPGSKKWYAIYKRKGDFVRPDSVWRDLGFANDFHEACNLYAGRNLPRSIDVLNRINREGPRDFGLAHQFLAQIFFEIGRYEQSIAHADSALMKDPYCVRAMIVKGQVYAAAGEMQKVAAIQDSLFRVCPWLQRP